MGKAGWYVYILECRNGHFYTGITDDLDRRTEQHRQGKGAKYTRAFGVRRVRFRQKFEDQSQAAKCEAQIKKKSRTEKIAMIKAYEKQRKAQP